ncbi:MAG: hypothetical protein ACI8PZ_002185 [Myxococcota bacterium]|jgi:hypothetical protein
MTLKSFPLAMAVVSLALWGCGEDAKDTATDTDTEATGTATGPGTSGPGGTDSGGDGGGGGGGGINPTGFGMIEAGFAYDNVGAEVRSYFLSDGTEQLAYYIVQAYDSRGDGCVDIVEAPGPITPKDDGWVASQGLYTGWEMAPGSGTVTSDCADVLGDASWIAFMEELPNTDTIGVGVGDITADAVTYSAAYISDWSEVESNGVGIGWYWSSLSAGYTWAPDGYLADGTGFAYEVDPDYNLVTDADSYLVFIPAADVASPGGGINDAFYRLFVSWNGISISF